VDETLPDAERDRRVLQRVSWLVQVQGVALSVLCLSFAIYALGGHHTHHGLAQAELEFVVGLVVGVFWTWAGRALGQGRRVAYSPLLLLELICLPVAWGLAQGHLWWYSALVGLPALVVVVVLASPVGRRVVAGDAD
jgi:hypothetical protein